jgi:hypothetical protein
MKNALFVLHSPGFASKQSSLQRGDCARGVRIAIFGQHLISDEVLNELEWSTTGRVVTIASYGNKLFITIIVIVVHGALRN